MLESPNTTPYKAKPSPSSSAEGASAIRNIESAIAGMQLSMMIRVPTRSTTWLANRNVMIAPAGCPSRASPSVASLMPSASWISGMRL